MSTGRSLPDVLARLALLVSATVMAVTVGFGPAMAAEPDPASQRQIEALVSTYYRAVAAEDADAVLRLHHTANTIERDRIRLQIERAFEVADSRFDYIRLRSVDVFPERAIGRARVDVEYVMKSFDGGDAISGSMDVVFILVRTGEDWKIGKVGRGADFDLTSAASRFSEMTGHLESTVPSAPEGRDAAAAAVIASTTVVSDGGEGLSAPSASPGDSAGGLTFFALRRKTSGRCEVVAGAEGISPGDTVLGAFPDFAEAQAAATSGCDGASAQAPPAVPASSVAQATSPLTTAAMYEPVEVIKRGTWASYLRIRGNGDLAGARDAGSPIDDGLFSAPGTGGPTEAVYMHDGSSVTLGGRAAVIDCISYCGRAGSVTFTILGDGRDLWASGMVRHGDPAPSFAVDLTGVRELRLVVTDGGNGEGEDWAAWLDLEVSSSEVASARPKATASPLPTAAGRPILAVPKYDGDQSTTGVFVVGLDNGIASFVDRLKGDPLSFRRRTVNRNVFTALGRPLEPAKDGEILAGEIRSGNGQVHALFLVDTSTGAAAYLGDLDRESHEASVRRITGFPAAAIASDDGNFALIMRRGGSGATDGALLYHATTGQCVYFSGLGTMRREPAVAFGPPLPVFDGRVTAIPLQSGSEATNQALVIDESAGRIYRLKALDRRPGQIGFAMERMDLFQFFPEASDDFASRRFLLVPGFSDNGATDSIFVIDAGSGRMAVLKNARREGGMTLSGSTQSIFSHLSAGEVGARMLAAVPKVAASGTTDGAWVFDSAGDEVLFLKNVRGPQNLRIQRATEILP